VREWRLQHTKRRQQEGGHGQSWPSRGGNRHGASCRLQPPPSPGPAGGPLRDHPRAGHGARGAYRSEVMAGNKAAILLVGRIRGRRGGSGHGAKPASVSPRRRRRRRPGGAISVPVRRRDVPPSPRASAIRPLRVGSRVEPTAQTCCHKYYLSSSWTQMSHLPVKRTRRPDMEPVVHLIPGGALHGGPGARRTRPSVRICGVPGPPRSEAPARSPHVPTASESACSPHVPAAHPHRARPAASRLSHGGDAAAPARPQNVQARHRETSRRNAGRLMPVG
jgi:hypothetical protein